MKKRPMNWFLAGLSLTTLLAAGCVEDAPSQEPAAAPVATDAPTTGGDAGGAQTVAFDPIAPDYTVLGEFEGSVDEQGNFDIRMLPANEWSEPPVVPGEGVEQALWCRQRVTSGALGTVGLSTSISSIGRTPAACGVANSPNITMYNFLGVFCADVTVRSFASAPLPNVVLEIYKMSPISGYTGYKYLNPTCCGTGANMAALPNGFGKPRDAFGAWLYDTIQPRGQVNDSATRKLMFQNAGGNFNFSGQVLATFTEVCNGLDDDCDGRFDEGVGCLLDGQACLAGDDCQAGVCVAGVCGIAEVVAEAVSPSGGGSSTVMSNGSNTVILRVGAPAPMGRAAGDNYQIELGPITAE